MTIFIQRIIHEILLHIFLCVQKKKVYLNIHDIIDLGRDISIKISFTRRTC